MRPPLIPSLVYRLLVIVQAPFGYVFWFIEQCKARIQDRIANEAGDE